MAKDKNKTEKEKSKKSEPINALLIPISIILAGMFIMVGSMASSSAIKSELESMRKQLTTLQASVASGVAPTATATPIPITADQVKEVINDSSNIRIGKADAKVAFIEFSDPSCPYCHLAGGKNTELYKSNSGLSSFKPVSDGGTYVAPVEEMRKLVNEGKASFTWIYTNGHGAGELGAQAQYCGHEKGKFWEVHDLLMSSKGYDILNTTIKNDKANSGALADFLKTAVDSSFMKSCLETGKYADRITKGNALSSTWQVGGTPGFFVNTVRFGGAQDYSTMKPTVDAELAK